MYHETYHVAPTTPAPTTPTARGPDLHCGSGEECKITCVRQGQLVTSNHY